VLDLLEPDQRLTLIRGVYDDLRQNPSGANPAFFDVYGAALADSQVLDDNPGAPTDIVEPLLQARNAAGLRWVRGQLQVRPNLFSHAPKDRVSSLRQRLSEELKAASKDEEDSETANMLQLFRDLHNLLRSSPKR